MSEPTDPREESIASQDTVEADPKSPGSSSNPRVVRGRRSPIAQKLGRYTLVRFLGRGGMGEVYVADDPELGRQVAIKVLRDDHGDRARLLREAQALAKLEHPHVVSVYDVGSTDDTVFLVMQLIDGDSIDRWQRDAHPGPRAIISAFVQAGRGLAAAHAAGLVHCDFKPSNVLIDRMGVVRVSDFGLARTAGEHGEIAGTPAFMAPEQFEGTATAASDQFSFCVALWQALAGQLPYDVPSSLDTTTKVAPERPRKAMPRAARMPTRVARALERGLAIDPAQRFASMDELLAALTPARRIRRFAAAGGLVFALGGVAALALARSPTPPPTPASPPSPPGPPRLELGAARTLTSYGKDACAYTPTVTAAGTIVYDLTESEAVDLYELPLAGGANRHLTAMPTWEWRASRGRTPGEVIYLEQDQGIGEHNVIAAIDLATGKSRPIVDVYAQDAAAVGDTIYYVPHTQNEIRSWQNGRDVSVASITTGKFGPITASPAGDRLAAVFTANDVAELCFLELPGGRLDCPHVPTIFSRPAFGADGRNIYYATHDGIRRRDLGGTADELVAPGVDAYGGIAIAPDGGVLAFSDCEWRSKAVEAANLERVVVDDPSVDQITLGPHGAIAWTRERRDTLVLLARLPDGRVLQLTNPSDGPIYEPSFSPDGTRVAYYVGGPHPGIRVVGVSVDHPVQEVTDDPRDATPFWADDHHLVFVRKEGADASSIHIVAADGGPLRRLATVGRTLYGAHDHRILAGTTERMLWIDTVTGAEHAGPPAPESIANAVLSPNGKWIAYSSGDAAPDVWRLSLDPPGKVEHIARLAAGNTTDGFAVEDDGRVIVVVSTWSGDLHVIPAAAGSKL
ncbi:MAG TPA: protein kinase [Kofleriaceae bacterium]|nr:protein kinase [Kofleriaceae bacterium]